MGILQVLRSKMVKNEANSSWTVEEVMKIYGSETKTEAKASKAVSSLVIPAGCSPYFVRRSASCANPFRKPEIKAPASQPCTAPSSLASFSIQVSVLIHSVHFGSNSSFTYGGKLGLHWTPTMQYVTPGPSA
ncbi:hypothetical protein TELCIR_18717 [Teladorsagia circumcincta]|uniref:Uncharacterized protein n=1 Tax=Teladorsagia circumcincta TaxID=45464 RepID=A0A2G9TPE5_TELCI|nr:hypothetical protein TELCIR_18717 [Teladorsagia circumcincta]